MRKKIKKGAVYMKYIKFKQLIMQYRVGAYVIKTTLSCLKADYLLKNTKYKNIDNKSTVSFLKIT